MAAEVKEPVLKDTRKRVKLYVLNEKRVWDDRGTGHVTCVYSDRHSGMSLFVKSESDGVQLLDSKIVLDTAYQKQQETLIVWSEGENFDLALSFQEKIGCDEIWEKICQVQGKDPNSDVTQEVGYEGESDSESGENVEPGNSTTVVAGLHLPPCELSHLSEISDLFSSSLGNPVRRESLALAIEAEGYIKKLLELFHVCEDLENIDSLCVIYQIMKSIFLLNKNAVYEILFSEENIYDVVGVLEYDPSSPVRKHHRDYLWKIAKFKEVIPISSPELKAKIHQTYRVQYIQDVILPTPSIFEENMLSVLSSFIFFNKVEIVSLIQDDEHFLSCLFSQLTDAMTETGRRRELICFLREFCSFSQTLQPQNREQFFRTVSKFGILHVIQVCIASTDDQIKAAAIEIFSNVVDYSPSVVREFILQQSHSQADDDLLFANIVIKQMFSDRDAELGGAVQLLGILRVLIDPENMMTSSTPNKTEKTEFLGFFYKRCMNHLCAPLISYTTESKPTTDEYRIAHMLSLILELLSFCVEHHAYHIRNHILSKDVLKRVLVLLKSRHMFLALGALRFLRRIVQLKDEFFNRYLIKNKLFEPIVECFLANGHRYNLLNSAILELFEFIRLEDIKSLCIYFVENHMEQFKDIVYVKTFQALRARYEQHQEKLLGGTSNAKLALGVSTSDGFRSPSISCVTSSPIRLKRDPRDLDEDEEAWFNEEDDEEWSDGSITPAVCVTNRPVGPVPLNSLTQTQSPLAGCLSAKCFAGSSVIVVSPSSASDPDKENVEALDFGLASCASSVLSASSASGGGVSPFAASSHRVVSQPMVIVASSQQQATAAGVVRDGSPNNLRANSPSEPVVLTNKVLVDYDVEDDSDEEISSSDSGELSTHDFAGEAAAASVAVSVCNLYTSRDSDFASDSHSVGDSRSFSAGSVSEMPSCSESLFFSDDHHLGTATGNDTSLGFASGQEMLVAMDDTLHFDRHHRWNVSLHGVNGRSVDDVAQGANLPTVNESLDAFRENLAPMTSASLPVAASVPDDIFPSASSSALPELDTCGATQNAPASVLLHQKRDLNEEEDLVWTDLQALAAATASRGGANAAMSREGDVAEQACVNYALAFPLQSDDADPLCAVRPAALSAQEEGVRYDSEPQPTASSVASLQNQEMLSSESPYADSLLCSNAAVDSAQPQGPFALSEYSVGNACSSDSFVADVAASNSGHDNSGAADFDSSTDAPPAKRSKLATFL